MLTDDEASEEFPSFFDEKVRNLCIGFNDVTVELKPDDEVVCISPEILDAAIHYHCQVGDSIYNFETLGF